MMLMRETAPLPAAMTPEIESLSVDPLLLGNVRETYAPYIRNGETAVFVRAHSEDDVDRAITMIERAVECTPANHPD